MALQLENLTEAMQRYLGLQQAQTLHADDLAADAIARLLGQRGDTAHLMSLWNEDAKHTVFEGFRPEHEAARQALVRVLDAGFVVQRLRNGQPRSLLSLSPRLITTKDANNTYREMGRSVVEGFWAFLGPTTRSELQTQLQRWEQHHPLARLLAPLCTSVQQPSRGPQQGNLAQILGEDELLRAWVQDVCTEDWATWLRMSRGLSVDEQLETMVSLLGLHLHVALLYRLRDLGSPPHLAGAPGVRPIFFLSLSTKREEVACERAAGTFYGFWGERAEPVLDQVARLRVEQLAAAAPDLGALLSAGSWVPVGGWSSVEITGRASARATKAYSDHIKQLARRAPTGQVSREEAAEAVARCYALPFRGPHGVITRIKDFLRHTGRAAGLVGPDEKHKRKRYQASGRALELLVRLHVHRERIRSNEEERLSVDAMLDDVFDRYGLIVTRERDAIRQALRTLQEQSRVLRPLLAMLPGDEAMRHNRALLDRKLEEMRFLRRFSDASAVLVVG